MLVYSSDPSPGVDHRRAAEGRVPVLPGVLHGPVPTGRAQDHQPEGHHGGHAQAAPRLQVRCGAMR